jgi:protein-S-isoprenylcysteine O-methyltransferase Ste14
MEKPSLLSQLIGLAILPGIVLILIPGFLIAGFGNAIEMNYNPWAMGLGTVVLVLGLLLMFLSFRLFFRVGMGTIAPWDPTKQLISQGIYRYVRNPMILGVVLVLLAESVLTSALIISLWAGLFWIGNHFYFVISEEPGLAKRFGESYIQYMHTVPRWLPKIRIGLLRNSNDIADTK